MFKSIKNLAIVHFRQNWLIELLTIIMFSIVIFILYTLFLRHQDLEVARDKAIWAWAITVAVYTIKSVFSGYGDMRKSYLKLLLPASIEAKFIWEWFRTLILFGGITLGLLFAVDAGVEYLYKIIQSDTFEMHNSRSLAEMLFIKNEPLNYLPVMMYTIVLWHSVAFLFSTRMAMIVGMFIIIAACMLTAFLPIGDDSQLLYPFISQQEGWRFLNIQFSWCSRGMEYLLTYLCLGALPIALYILSYFRIKESEI